jgi:high affinity sulfate transporter 1
VTVAGPARIHLPGIEMVRTYRRAWLPDDLVAGLVLTAVLVPVGMGYAEAAGLPAITGLYATIVPLLVYALLGPSRILVLGPDSSLAAIIAATVVPLSAGDPERAVALAGGLALISGVFGIAFGLLHLGLLTDLLSKPIRIGYLHGIALTVVIGQLPKLFGFLTDAEGVVAETAAFLTGVAAGAANTTALGIGVLALAVMVAARRIGRAAIGIVAATAVTTILTGIAGLATGAGVEVVGALPQGLPRLAMPAVGLADLGAMLAGGLAIAVVSLADTSVLSRTFALRSGARVDQDQELIALGGANLGAAFTSGFPISASASRTPVAEAAGGRTQVTGVVGALAIVALLVFVPGLTTFLPQPTLAAIVILACFSLVDLDGLRRLIRLSPNEAVLSMVCFAGVAFVGVVAGIFVAVLLALAAFFWRAWRPHSAILGRVDGMKGYHDVTRYPDAQRFDGLVLFRWDAPLFFANADAFREAVEAAMADAAQPVRWLVIAAEPVTDVDISAADLLADFMTALDDRDIRLRFAELKDPVKDRLRRFGLLERLGADAFYPTVGSAVDAYLDASATGWPEGPAAGDGAGLPPMGSSSSA